MKRIFLILTVVLLVAAALIASSPLYAAPNVYQDIEGAYSGKVRLKFYNLNGTFAQYYRYLYVDIWNQEDDLITPVLAPVPGPGATAYICLTQDDLNPLEINMIGTVGDDLRSRIVLAGVNEVTADAVMITGRVYYNRDGSARAMKGVIQISHPGDPPGTQHQSCQGSFSLPWHEFE